MTLSTVYCNSSDGYVGNTDADYNTARGGATGDATDNTSSYISNAISGERDGADGDFTFNRAFFDFTMPSAGGIIKGVDLKLRIADFVNFKGFAVYESSHAIPLVAGGFDDYGDLWGVLLSGTVGEVTVELNSTAIAAIDWGDTVKICVRERRNDKENNVPPTSRSCGVYFYENGTTTRPKLEITHEPRKMSPGIAIGSYSLY